ncbi:MAG: bifunctional folylpolyglutamate synthase/dihydrofolate synthase [Saccharofermentans sp.]|nr:bifunctional folylpolyglutamate synthase/dihydrofolate synthase [Saccharofermentans sp.]
MDANNIPEFIKDAQKFGINLGLERMNELDRLLGNPEKSLKAVHVAGTNGKGSVVTYISCGLAAANYKVGVYTSPFLERFSERMRVIDGKAGLNRLEQDESTGEINSDDLTRLSKVVEEKAKEMSFNGFEHPTEFELVTAVAFLWFKEQGVDVVVLETGLGGRLDSTNVFDNPLATVITTIGLDHTDRLGDTIDKITREKAGIFKYQAPAFASNPDDMLLDEELKPIVRNTLIEVAGNKDTTVTFVGANTASAKFTSDGKMHFEAFGEEYETSLQGKHQVLNASLAIKVLINLGVDVEAIKAGIKSARWKGRAELLSTNPAVILDGGHNVQCATSLVETINLMCDGEFKDKELRVVMGAMADKDVEGMITTLRDSRLKIKEIYTVLVNNPRAISTSNLSNLLDIVYNNSIKHLAFEDANEGVLAAYAKSREDGLPLLVTGSLYLIGEVRGSLCTTINN